jgi:hypothetical protein
MTENSAFSNPVNFISRVQKHMHILTCNFSSISLCRASICLKYINFSLQVLNYCKTACVFGILGFCNSSII